LIAAIESRQLTILYECFTFEEGVKMQTSCRMFNFLEIKIDNEPVEKLFSQSSYFVRLGLFFKPAGLWSANLFRFLYSYRKSTVKTTLCCWINPVF
jgi:hypothetical protein